MLELLERTAFECLPRLERPPTFLPADQRAQYLLRQISEEFSELRGAVVDLESRVEELEECEDSRIGDLERELDDTADELDECLAENNRLATKVNTLTALLTKNGIPLE